MTYIGFDEIIRGAQRTHQTKSKLYSSAYQKHGEIMRILFPDGITLSSSEDFSRFSLFNVIIMKADRYAKNFQSGGHPDSIHDLGVYAFMLEELDLNFTLNKVEENKE